MRVIKAEFRRLDEYSLPGVIGAVGVYVIWDGQARARPTYIGEGTILKRLAEHSTRFALPFDGYMAILGDLSSRTAKREAEILEALLLSVAYETDRLPIHNRAPGKTTEIQRVLANARMTGVLSLTSPYPAAVCEIPTPVLTTARKCSGTRCVYLSVVARSAWKPSDLPNNYSPE